MNKKVLIITGAGLAIGFAEALIYYNLGKNDPTKEFKLQIPKGAELKNNRYYHRDLSGDSSAI